MLILLPPSEGKASGQRGRPLDLDRLSFSELAPTRTAVIDALVAASGRDDALAVLGAPAGAKDQVSGNVDLWTAPTLPASGLYTGVLYDALDLASLDAAAKRRANKRLVVVSALFGALRPSDRVPSYRLSMDVDLPGVGKLAAAWRDPLAAVLPEAAGRGLVVDMRSSTYVAAWKPVGALGERTVSIHVVREENGKRSVVSHMAKHTRGLVARHLLETGIDPRTPEALADALADEYHVELENARAGRPRRLEIVEPA
ncbi:YaaA family protein [Actinospongicola halichondriae]|uniref:YaaA family protein n=1 Tax=Actinospongicola halichondriae TaxID=3236844 RepID=UPI003D595849